MQCPFCSYNSQESSQLAIHMKVVHFGIPENEADFEEPEIGGVDKKSKRNLHSWFDGCEFHCPKEECGKVCASRSRLTRHWQLTHYGDVAGLSEYDVKTVIKHWECKKCNLSVLRTRDSIRAHLARSHKCSIAEYETEFGCDEVEDLDRNTKGQVQTNGMSAGRPWYDGCEYHCPIDFCVKVFSTFNLLSRHWKMVHKESAESLEHCDIRKVISQFECKKCHRLVQRNADSIRVHLHRYHRINLKEYEEKFESGGNDKTDRGPESENISEDKGSRPWRRPGDAWYNGCKYHCPADSCKKVFPIKDTLTKHWKLVHGRTKSSLKDSDIIEEIAYYKCKKCLTPNPIQKTRSAIRLHIASRHLMSFAEYEKEFHSDDLRQDEQIERTGSGLKDGNTDNVEIRNDAEDDFESELIEVVYTQDNA